jgi:hypothetical protein
MSKKNLPNRRLHKASGQAFVILLSHDGIRRCHYLGKYSSPESRSEYDRLIGIYTANGRKMPPPESESKSDLVKELAVKYLQWAEGYYQNSPRESFWHHTNVILNFLVKDYRNKPVRESVYCFPARDCPTNGSPIYRPTTIDNKASRQSV